MSTIALSDDLTDLKRYGYVVVKRCHPEDPTWLRARAMLRAFGLDPRQFKDEDVEPGMQLLERALVAQSADWRAARVPADYYSANPRFAIAATMLVHIPLEDHEQIREFCSAIAEVRGSLRHRALQRVWKFDAMRVAQTYACDYERAAERMEQSSSMSRDVYAQQYRKKALTWNTKAQALQAELANAGDLPATAQECKHLADNGFTEFWVGLSGPMRFERAVKEFVVREEAALKAELSQAWPQSERARGG